LTHQTGRPALKARAIRQILSRVRPDVAHFHNLSLIGGPGLLEIPMDRAVKLRITPDTGSSAHCTSSGSRDRAYAKLQIA